MENFTPEQEKLIDKYHDEWVALSYSTGPVNIERLTKSTAKLYALEKLPAPKIQMCDGPVDLIKTVKKAGDKRADNEIWADVFEGPWSMTGLQFYRFGEEIDPNIYDKKDSEELHIWLDMCQDMHCGLFYNEIAFFCHRPTALNVDELGNLHCTDGPSLAYRDGTKFFDWHGVEVPEFVIMKPETITIDHIEKESNAEVRRVMVERFGLERFIKESGAKVIHKDKDPMNGDQRILYRKEVEGDESIVMVQVKNSTPEPDGSIKDYFIRVPPTITKAGEAVAWTFGLKEEEYRPLVQT